MFFCNGFCVALDDFSESKVKVWTDMRDVKAESKRYGEALGNCRP